MTEILPLSSGRRALISGGASGIGAGVAKRLVGLGAKVAVADLPASLSRLPEADQAAFELIAMDVTDDVSVSAGVAEAVERLGGLDTLVNSAGVFQFRALEDVTTSEWDRILGVNLRGTFLLMREAMPHLKASHRGRVVNIASDAGKTGFPLLGAYCASKFGVVGLTQAVAVEVAPDGVRVNAVCPATIAETAMGRQVVDQKIQHGYGRSREEILERGAAAFPLKRVGTVADVVEAVLFLISESSSWVTGETLNVDGGSLAG